MFSNGAVPRTLASPFKLLDARLIVYFRFTLIDRFPHFLKYLYVFLEAFGFVHRFDLRAFYGEGAMIVSENNVIHFFFEYFPVEYHIVVCDNDVAVQGCMWDKENDYRYYQRCVILHAIPLR